MNFKSFLHAGAKPISLFPPVRGLPLYKQLLAGMKEVIPHQAGGTKWDTRPGFLSATNKEALSVSRGHQSAVK